MSTEGTAAVIPPQRGKDHEIFKSCICCGFDTLESPEWTRHMGPSYQCPNRGPPTFIMACSQCLFLSSRDCPLTQLLGKTHEVYLTEGSHKGLRDIVAEPRGIETQSKEKEAVCEIKIDDAFGDSCRIHSHTKRETRAELMP